VTLNDIIYHTQCVVRGNRFAWVIADLPFGTYHENLAQALRSATLLMQAGAHMIKLEGGSWTPEVVYALTQRGIPVCAHLGLTPQSVHALGGYRIQGKSEESARVLLTDAKALADAGASMMVLELMPTSVAAQVQSQNPHVMTIGIGAGAQTAGQVLVLHDMLKLSRHRLPRFVRDFTAEGGSPEDAIRRFVMAVKEGSFPDEQRHGY
jgi:3-methyl-2-oxobutanoate hydroxymethyltransferase